MSEVENPPKKQKTQQNEIGKGEKETEVKDDDLLSPNSILSPHILLQRAEWKIQYGMNKIPFSHLVWHDTFRLEFLKGVLKEIKDNSQVNFKESDLFRVYQSFDLANLSTTDTITDPLLDNGAAGTAKAKTTGLAKNAESSNISTDKMPHTLRLRSLLYSSEWRSFIEEVAGLPPGTLTDQVDCACNCHLTGCHLLCHDDVIGTRRISYILYLTEPDPVWEESEGGALELYNSILPKQTPTNKASSASVFSQATRIPENIPCQKILPIFNSMAFFEVKPGQSFHAVQEVLGDRPRLSMQGWYHAREPPAHMEAATLNRLKQHKDTNLRYINPFTRDTAATFREDAFAAAEDTTGPFVPFEDAVEVESSRTKLSNGNASTPMRGNDNTSDIYTLSSEDRIYLSNFIQATYLQTDSMSEIAERFEQDGSVQLRHFLIEAWSDRMQQAAIIQEDQRARSIMSAKSKSSMPPSDSGGDCSSFYNYYAQGVTDPSRVSRSAGATRGWKLTGPPHKQRFLEYCDMSVPASRNKAYTDAKSSSFPSSSLQTDDSEEAAIVGSSDLNQSDTAGELMYQLQTHLLESPAFRRYLALLTSLACATGRRACIRRFRRGLDYTVAHYGLLLGPQDPSVLDATLCFVAGTGAQVRQDDDNADAVSDVVGSKIEAQEADIEWQMGDHGGFECYIAADDEGNDDNDSSNKGASAEFHGAADEYNEDDGTELLSVSASNNTLSLVYRDPGTMRFVKYVGSRAPSSRWDIALEYEVPEDKDDAEEEA